MSLTVNGVNKNQTSQPTAASTAPAQETQNLFGSEETSKTEKADTAAQKTLLEAELAKLEQQLAQLEAKKSEKAPKQEAAEPKVEEKVEKTVEVETPSEEKKEVVETNDLSALTLSDLKAKAKEAGIKGYSTMKKAEIIAALEK